MAIPEVLVAPSVLAQQPTSMVVCCSRHEHGLATTGRVASLQQAAEALAGGKGHTNRRSLAPNYQPKWLRIVIMKAATCHLPKPWGYSLCYEWCWCLCWCWWCCLVVGPNEFMCHAFVFSSLPHANPSSLCRPMPGNRYRRSCVVAGTNCPQHALKMLKTARQDVQ